MESMIDSCTRVHSEKNRSETKAAVGVPDCGGRSVMIVPTASIEFR